jgi:signal transduction histidine kinase/CheY-like chemotaxis protein/HPt (histidine-containing phosphotransfer) domain-containing protein
MLTRTTRLFDSGVMALVGVSILLGCVVVATFSAIGARQRATEESVREDAVWAAYQLDSEVKKLIGAVRDLEKAFIAPRRADVTLRYDILYSRASVLTSNHYATKFGGETELVMLAQEARERILKLAPLIDALDLAAEPARQVSPLLLELETLGHLSERLLNVSNLAHSRIRVQDRAELRSVYERLAGAMTALIVSLAAIVVYLGTQLRHIRISRRRSERLSIENAEAAKRAEAGARAKSIFLATMSHEIRTPLNGIIGMVDIMRDSAMSPGQRDRLAVIGDCSDTLLELIDDILDFSKLESGAVEFELAPFELGEVCSAVSNVMGQRAREKGIVLHVDNPQALVTTDATRLRQILFNLVGNAVKFTDSGWVRLACSLDQGGCLRVEVEDTGIGIPAEARDRLFQDFSQLDITINRRFGGTGLGLAICRRLIGALGGEIGVSPREGGGTCFWFTLPVGPVASSRGATASAPAQGPAQEPGQEPAQEPAHDRSFSGRILVAEDNLINFVVVGELLQRLGLQVDHAPNGEIAVHLAGATHYDLVLMDMQMPVMDGLAATRSIRQLGLATLPIIALTANAFSSDRADCLAAGMNDFVAKPINRAKLTAILAKWLPAYASAIAPQSAAEKAERPDEDGGAGLIDHAARDELRRELGDDLLSELTRDFWPDATRMVSAAGKAFAAGETDLAIRELHTLKGVAGTLGLVAVAAAAGAAEHALLASGAPDLAVLQATLLRTILTMEASDASRDIPASAASA